MTGWVAASISPTSKHGLSTKKNRSAYKLKHLKKNLVKQGNVKVVDPHLTGTVIDIIGIETVIKIIIVSIGSTVNIESIGNIENIGSPPDTADLITLVVKVTIIVVKWYLIL